MTVSTNIPNVNIKQVLEMLREFQTIYELIGDVYRAKAYTTAITSVRNGTPLSAKSSITAKVQSCIQGERIDELIELRRNDIIKASYALRRIPGVGPQTVARWYKLGIKTISGVKEAVTAGKISLTHIQEIGLKYYSDLGKPIPRAEMTTIIKVILRIVQLTDPGIVAFPAGSYRRQAATSGDVDILLTYTSGTTRPDLAAIMTNIKKLLGVSYIATMSAGAEKTSLLCRIATYVRHIDLISVPARSSAAALLYLTGSAEFNESMRGLAKSKGMLLNQHGLYRSGRPLPTPTERDIFTTIGMKYVEPKNRT